MLLSRVGHVLKSHELIWWRGFWRDEEGETLWTRQQGQVGYLLYW